MSCSAISSPGEFLVSLVISVLSSSACLYIHLFVTKKEYNKDPNKQTDRQTDRQTNTATNTSTSQQCTTRDLVTVVRKQLPGLRRANSPSGPAASYVYNSWSCHPRYQPPTPILPMVSPLTKFAPTHVVCTHLTAIWIISSHTCNRKRFLPRSKCVHKQNCHKMKQEKHWNIILTLYCTKLDATMIAIGFSSIGLNYTVSQKKFPPLNSL